MGNTCVYRLAPPRWPLGSGHHIYEVSLEGKNCQAPKPDQRFPNKCRGWMYFANFCRIVVVPQQTIKVILQIEKNGNVIWQEMTTIQTITDPSQNIENTFFHRLKIGNYVARISSSIGSEQPSGRKITVTKNSCANTPNVEFAARAEFDIVL